MAKSTNVATVVAGCVAVIGAVVIVTVVGFVFGRFAPAAGVDTQQASAQGPAADTIGARELGDKWPLTVPVVKLRCDKDGPRRYVTATTDTKPGVDYAVNGAARDFGYPTITTIQKPGGGPADLQPLIDRGLPLCDR